MVKKSISVTDQQNSWIKAQIETGRYGNESEVIRDLIRERQSREQETPAEIEAIRAALIEAEQSVKQNGYSDKSIDDIWQEASARFRAGRG
ncbi:MAG: type II toxin-antitoxin system ParD family antitoxin [Magnetospiraceae bacterium]